jgi:hypothetical protein
MKKIASCLGPLLLAAALHAEPMTLVNYFLPMKPQGPLVAEGIWGAPNVLPRDIKNGLIGTGKS